MIAINTGGLTKILTIPNVTAQGMSFGTWEVMVTRVE